MRHIGKHHEAHDMHTSRTSLCLRFDRLCNLHDVSQCNKSIAFPVQSLVYMCEDFISQCRNLVILVITLPKIPLKYERQNHMNKKSMTKNNSLIV